MVLYGQVASKGTLDKSISPDTAKRYGLGWPIGDPNNGKAPFFKKASSIHLIRSQIIQLIKTKKGERPMLPQYGLDIEKYLFNNLTSESSSRIVREIQESMANYAPNVKLLRAKVFQNDNIIGIGAPGIKIILTVSPTTDNTPTEISVTL